MKFKELLEILIADENLCIEVGNDEDYGTFGGKVSKFAEDERFHDLDVLDLKSVIVRDHEDGRIDDNIMSVTTELWISLYDPECKVLDDEQ